MNGKEIAKNLQASGHDLSRHCPKGLRTDQWNFDHVSRHRIRRFKRTLVNTTAALHKPATYVCLLQTSAHLL